MRRVAQYLLATNVVLGALFFAGCETVPQGIQQARIEMSQQIAAEPSGDYYIGRRYYKPDYKFWGYVRKAGQPWSTAELVMLNEKEKLAPDRERLEFGSDNNYEYKLYGYFSGDKVYEPASNGIYPEFVLKKYELISTTPAPIFKSQMSGLIQPTCDTLSRNPNERFVIPSGSRKRARSRGIPQQDLKALASRFLDCAGNDTRSSRGGIPALSRERAECFTAHAQGIPPCVD